MTWTPSRTCSSGAWRRPLAAALTGAGAVTALLLILAPAAGLLAGGLLAAGVAVPWLAARTARRSAQRTAAARGRLTGAVTDALAGAAELHAFGAEGAALARAADADAELTALARRTAAAAGLGTGLTALAAGATLWAVLLLGVAVTGDGRLGRVPLAVITLAALAAFEAVTPLPAAAIQLGQSARAARRVTAVLDAPTPSARPSPRLRPACWPPCNPGRRCPCGCAGSRSPTAPADPAPWTGSIWTSHRAGESRCSVPPGPENRQSPPFCCASWT